jgi:hypothetical protein
MIHFSGTLGYRDIVLSDVKLKWGNGIDMLGNPRDWCPIENIKKFRLHKERKQDRLREYNYKLFHNKKQREEIEIAIEKMNKSIFRFYFKYQIKSAKEKVNVLNEVIERTERAISQVSNLQELGPSYKLEIYVYNDNFHSSRVIGNQTITLESNSSVPFSKILELADALEYIGIPGIRGIRD